MSERSRRTHPLTTATQRLPVEKLARAGAVFAAALEGSPALSSLRAAGGALTRLAREMAEAPLAERQALS